jgi:hypothetical protein
MNRQRASCVTLLAMIFATCATAHEPASDGCATLSRDVVHELAVMRSPAIPMSAEAGRTGRPRLVLDEHYALNLIAQGQLRFAAKPGRGTRASSPRGGAFQFEVPVTGRYRISITSRHWIDVVDGEKVVASADHFGPACDVLHKIVEFDLSSGHTLTLQLSGQDDAIIGLAITASPPAPKQERS